MRYTSSTYLMNKNLLLPTERLFPESERDPFAIDSRQRPNLRTDQHILWHSLLSVLQTEYRFHNPRAFASAGDTLFRRIRRRTRPGAVVSIKNASRAVVSASWYQYEGDFVPTGKTQVLPLTLDFA